MRKYLYTLCGWLLVSLCTACGNKAGESAATSSDTVTVSVPAFQADSAYASIVDQCNFGPRVPNSEAHTRCGDYLVHRFRSYGLTVSEQRVTLPAYDGTPLRICNIMASYAPERGERILLCAHWDSRPWADNDPDETNYRRPVPAANDGASGVAVLLEIARLIREQQPAVGIDFVCFDAEDYGVPQWDEGVDEAVSANSWCIGSQYFAANLPWKDSSRPRYAILLDMVGGQGAYFYQEGFSLHYAQSIVNRVWEAALRAGYGSMFPSSPGGYITDDHVPLNRLAGIPAIDIIPYYPAHPTSSFGSTWHTLSDDPAHIDRNTLRAVGQTLLQVIYEEKP